MPKQLSLEDIEKITDNKYLAVCIAAKRARQLSDGDRSIIKTEAVKESTIALYELAEGKLSYTYKKEIEAPKEGETDVLALDMEEISEGKTEFDNIFKEEYVDDSGADIDDEEPEEGL